MTEMSGCEDVMRKQKQTTLLTMGFSLEWIGMDGQFPLVGGGCCKGDHVKRTLIEWHCEGK